MIGRLDRSRFSFYSDDLNIFGFDSFGMAASFGNTFGQVTDGMAVVVDGRLEFNRAVCCTGCIRPWLV